jgi:hypothetical protein
MYLQESSIESISNYFKNLAKNESVTYLLLFAEKTAPDMSRLILTLNQIGISFAGGIFPSVISGRQHHETGLIIQALPHTQKPVVIENISRAEEQLQQISITKSQYKQTHLILVDGITQCISDFLFEIYNKFGNAVNYLGCGAGSLSLESKACLISNKGFFKDAAIICPLKLESKLGVRHGWYHVAGPFIATKTEKNIIHELNWEPAFDFYQKRIAEHSNEILKSEEFFRISKSYPFGIYKEKSDFIVRDPILSNGKSITCIAEVPENTVLYLLTSDNDSLIEAANTTFTIDDQVETQAKLGLAFDCVSRALFLEQDFDKELFAIQQSFQEYSPEINAEGALSLGEIALNGKGNLEFFNKTVVTGILY